MPITSSSALYYPYIDVRNERWLRSASLFWDTIRTIVPESLRDPYSKAFARELSDEGVLVPIRVSSDMPEVESLTDTVMDYLTDPASEAVLYPGDHSSGMIHGEKLPRELRNFTEVHPAKLPYVIREHLEHALNDDGWYEVDPGFSNFYMTLLASKLAERLGIGLATESTTADQLAIAVHKGKPRSPRNNNSRRRFGRHYEATGDRRELPKDTSPGLFMELIVQSIEIPMNVSVRDLLKFKKDHREELAVFRREVARLMADLPEHTSVEALRQSMTDQYEAQVAPAIRSLKQSLAAQGWDTALNGFLKASFFSAAPASAAIFAGLPTAVALLAGAGLSLTASAVLLANQRKRAKIESPYSYLLSLERRWR